MSPVVGYNAYVWRLTGRHVDVSPFTSTLGKLQRVPVVDAMVHYECPVSLKEYILIIFNALYIPTMQNNLIPPFAIREAGVEVSERPKIHTTDPSIQDHCLYFEEEELRIHLGLQGIISYFNTRHPSPDEIESLPRLHLTPDRDHWDPHEEAYSRQEECMLDFEGNIIDKDLREKQFFDFSDEQVVSSVDLPVAEDINDHVVSAISERSTDISQCGMIQH